MILLRFAFALCLLTLCCACGGSKAPAESAETMASDSSASTDPQPEVDAEPTGEPGKMAIPASCNDGDDPCLPDPKWVRKLCQDVYPAVALVLFHKGSPFTHAYLSRKTKAVNASGGATSGDEWLAFDEEVILLYHRGSDAGGIQVSGASGGYDALRLDGSCVTLDGSEVRLQEPPQPKYSKVPWRYIGEDMQDALREVPSVREAYIARRKECRGAFSGTVTNTCIKKDEALNSSIIAALQEGTAKLPEPAGRP